MQLDKFTTKSQEAIQRAQQLTIGAENQAVGQFGRDAKAIHG